MINKMKRVNSFLIAAFVAASSMLVVSCSKDDDEVEDPTIKVTMKYKDGTKDVSENVGIGTTVSLPEGTDITFDIDFTMGTKPIKEVHIKSVIDNKTFKILDSVDLDKGLFNSGAKKLSYTYKTAVGKNAEKITFNLLDTANPSNESSADITVSPPAAPAAPADRDYYYTVSSVTLLGQSQKAGTTTPYCYDVKNGKVWDADAAKSQSDLIDLVYYYGSNNKATICSPSNADVIGTNGFTKIKAFPTKNTTIVGVFTPESTATVKWDSDANIDAWVGETTAAGVEAKIDAITGDAVTQLETQAGAVLAFKTKAGTRGFIVGITVSGNATGSISFKILEYKKK